MTAPHTESDDRAILAAHDQRPAFAAARLRSTIEAFLADPSSQWLRDAALGAVQAAHTEGIATMRREMADLRAAQRLPGYADLMLLDCKP